MDLLWTGGRVVMIWLFIDPTPTWLSGYMVTIRLSFFSAVHFSSFCDIARIHNASDANLPPAYLRRQG